MWRIHRRRCARPLNAFDLVVTVALGSTLSTVVLSKDQSLAEGAVALGLLVGWQYVIAWLCVRAHWARRIFNAQPALLFHNKEFLEHALRRQRVTNEQVRAAVLSEGFQDMRHMAAIVLETDGSFSVIRADRRDVPECASALKDTDLFGKDE
jgi:uncharacterized membrane protein YcaP (DUF421 family)